MSVTHRSLRRGLCAAFLLVACGGDTPAGDTSDTSDTPVADTSAPDADAEDTSPLDTSEDTSGSDTDPGDTTGDSIGPDTDPGDTGGPDTMPGDTTEDDVPSEVDADRGLACTPDLTRLASDSRCREDDDCPCGSYCDLGLCAYDCLAHAECDEGYCDRFGRCGPPSAALGPAPLGVVNRHGKLFVPTATLPLIGGSTTLPIAALGRDLARTRVIASAGLRVQCGDEPPSTTCIFDTVVRDAAPREARITRDTAVALPGGVGYVWVFTAGASVEVAVSDPLVARSLPVVGANTALQPGLYEGFAEPAEQPLALAPDHAFWRQRVPVTALVYEDLVVELRDGSQRVIPGGELAMAATAGGTAMAGASSGYTLTGRPAILAASGPSSDPQTVQVVSGPFMGDLSYWESGRFEATLTPPLGPLGEDPTGTLVWDFEDGTLDGWVAVHDDAARGMGVGMNANTLATGGGEYALEPRSFGDREAAHDRIVMRSPAFLLDPSQDIVVTMLGGRASGVNGSGFYPANADDLAASTSSSTGQRKMGFAVRRISDGAYIAFGQRLTASDTTWEEVTVSGLSLSGHAFEAVTLDVYDAFAGSFGWVAVDSVRAGGRLVTPTSSIDGTGLFSTPWRLVLSRSADLPAGAVAPGTRAQILAAHGAGLAGLAGLMATDRAGPTRAAAQAFAPRAGADSASFAEIVNDDLLACAVPTPSFDRGAFWNDYAFWLSERPGGFAEKLSEEIRFGLLMATTKHHTNIFWATMGARERTINGLTLWQDNLHTWLSDAMRTHASGEREPGVGHLPCAGRFRTRSWVSGGNSACCTAGCIPAYSDCIDPAGCETFDFCDEIDQALREAGEPGCTIEEATYERPLFAPSGHCWRLPNAVGQFYNATNGAGANAQIYAQVEVTVTRHCRQPGGASALISPRPAHCAEGLACAATPATFRSGRFADTLDERTDDLTCASDAESSAGPLVGLLDESPPVGELGLDACVDDLRDAGVSLAERTCFSKGRMLAALDHALAGVDGRARLDPKAGRLANYILAQLLGVQAFVANEVKGQAELGQVLAAAGNRPCEYDFAEQLDRLAASIEAWDILLHPNQTDALRSPLFTDALVDPDARADYTGAAPAPTRPPGLPVSMAGVLTAQAEALGYLLDRMRLAQAQCEVDVDIESHLDGFSWRATLALGLMRGLAERAFEATGVDGPGWWVEWETAYARALGAVGGVNQAIAGLASDKNPIGIEDTDLPLYFSGDEASANERFGAISRFLVGIGGGPELAPRYVEAAQSALAQARDAWIAQSDRSIAERRDSADLEARLEEIRRRFGTPIQSACGLTGTSLGVLDQDIDPERCYVSPDCAWSPTDRAERADVGVVTANLCMLSRLRAEYGDQVTSLSPTLDATADQLLPQFQVTPVIDLGYNFMPSPAAGGVDLRLRDWDGTVLHTFALRGTAAVGAPLVRFVLPRAVRPDRIAFHQAYCRQVKGHLDANRPDDVPSTCTTSDRCPRGMMCTRGLCGLAIDPIDALAGTCFRGTLGEMRASFNAAKLDVEVARQSFAEFSDRYDIAMRSCAIRQISAMRIQRALEEHNNTMTALGAVKLTADISSNLAEATKDCASTTNEAGFGGLVSGGTTAVVACGAAVVEGVADTLSDSMQFAMDEAVRNHEETVAQLESEADLFVCQNDASLELVGARTAAIEIQKKFADLQAAYLELSNTQATVLSLLEEGRLALANEEARHIPLLEHDLWLDERVDRFHRVMRLARRMTYLAVRAVEYEFQFTSSERGKVLAAAHPDVLEGVVQSLELQLLAGGIAGKRPSLSPPTVVSLRDHLLQLGDSSGAPDWAQNMTPRERFVALITSPQYAVYSETGVYLGQRVPFKVAAMEELELGNDTVAPFFSRFSCAERIWAINVGLPGISRLDGRTFTNLIIEQRNTFYSQRCGEPGPNEDTFWVASVRPGRNLFSDPLVDGDAGLNLTATTADYLEDETQAFAAARIQARAADRATLEDETYLQGDSEELATRALFGDYAIFFPADELDGYGRPGGLRLHELEDVLIRFDYVSVAD